MSQQNDTEMTATSSSQATTEPLSTDAATSGNNISASADDGIDAEVINQLIARAISYAEQANTALQSNDTEGASRNLNFALNELESIQGNLTSNTSGSNNVGGTNEDSNNASSEATTSPSTPSSQPQQQEQPSSSPSPFSQQLQSQQEQEEGPPQQQLLQQEQNEGGASVSIVEDSSTLTTDAFTPNPIQVSVGSTVTWTNNDSVIHTVNSGTSPTESGLFTSPIMNPGDTFEYTFTEADEVPYFCMLHPNQVGTVSVAG
jgi:plastocyanin